MPTSENSTDSSAGPERVLPGTDLTVIELLRELGTGLMIEDLLKKRPELTAAAVQEALAYAAEDPAFRECYSRVATDYKLIWNVLASERRSAYNMVDESTTEEQLRAQGSVTANMLRSALALEKTDTVLEIGCGVARIGRELAEGVGHWIGVDVSENMLLVAAERLSRCLPEARFSLVAVPGNSLRGVATNSVDKIYCHAVFVHMDKEDSYQYLLEARRVLRADGLFYFDVWNICDPVGWLRFEHEMSMYASRQERPAHRNQFHSPDEVRMMLAQADLEPLSIAENYQIQVVSSHAGDDDVDPAAWRKRMASTYERSYERARWTPEEIAGFRDALLRASSDGGS